MDVLIEAGGTIHRLDEATAVLLAENLRAHPKYEELCTQAADKIEEALVDPDDRPIIFDEGETVAVADYVDVLSPGKPDLVALFWALSGRLPGPENQEYHRRELEELDDP